MYAMTATVEPANVRFATPALTYPAMRELTPEEIESVSGGFINNLIGGAVGGAVSVGVSVALGNTSLTDLGGAFVTGAALGAVTSGGSAVATAATLIRGGQAGLVSGAVFNGATTTL